MDPAHSTFGPYTLLREIARGGMGIVYLAEDLAGIRVALKLPRPELATDPRERARFVQEMRLTASLHHPNIVQILQGGDERGHLYLAMEYVEGSTLRAEIDRRGRLPPLETIRIAAQVARGLAAAHDHNPAIVHRDLKPGNVLLRSDGVAKVTDFGIAKAFDVGAHATTTPMGTPVYMSPEQLNGELSSPASDIHALGIILYEALTGTLPFASTLSVARLIHAICFDMPPAVSAALGNTIPPELDTLVADCLAKAPERRPRALDVAARLHAIESRMTAGAQPIHTPPPIAAPVSASTPPPLDTIGLIQRLEQPRSKAPVVAAVALVGAVGLGSGAWLLSNRDTPDTAAPDDDAKGPSTPASATASSRSAPAECETQTALADVAPLQMICIPSGSFSMGSRATDVPHEDDETPQHTAEVAAFLVGATEVTQAQWTAVMGDQPFDCTAGCGADLPAQNITWTRAVEFANALSVREKLPPCYATTDGDALPTDGCTGYRLPTETEWEYAARAGTTTRFSFGDDAALVDAHAWHDGGAGVHPVGTKTANPWGLFDVHGNVWEWVQDWHADYADAPKTASFLGPTSGVFKVFRGGSFKKKSGGPRVADRGFYKPGGLRKNLGLRLARSPRGREFFPVEAKQTSFGTCDVSTSAWAGGWRLDTIATDATNRAWIGAPGLYDIVLMQNGCALTGTGTRTQGSSQQQLTLSGAVDEFGSAVIDYDSEGGGIRGAWTLESGGGGTFRSRTGDVSGTVTYVRRLVGF